MSDSKSSSSWGGSQHQRHDKVNTMPVKNQIVKKLRREQTNVRAEKMAGGSEKRGNSGKYLLVIILVMSTILLVPITHDMPDSKDQDLIAKLGDLLDTKLDKKLDPVLTKVNDLETKIETEVSKIRTETKSQLSKLETDFKSRLDKVEKSQQSRPAEPVPNPPPEQTPQKRTLAQIVASTTPPKVGEELVKAVESEEKKMAGKKGAFRFKDKDYAARQQASPEDIERAESLWRYGYLTVGLFPCGSNSDFTRAKETLAKRGAENPTKKELMMECAQEFLRKDMGITDDVMKRLYDDLEEVFMTGNTCFLKMRNREAIQQIYSFSNLMGRMAEQNGVKRKLHAWIPVTLEQRFFGLKRLEYTMRDARGKKGQKIHTRIFYRDGQIFAQWKGNYREEYRDIEEPASAKIPGTEFWRKTPSPRLNNMPKGAPIHKPPLNAPVPSGRQRTDEAGKRGRGGYRGGRGGRGGGNASGGNNRGNSERQEVVVPAGGESSQSSVNVGASASTDTAPNTQTSTAPKALASATATIVKAPENSKAAPTFAGQFNKLTRGSKSSAGSTPFSMRRKRSVKTHITQANTILKYAVTETPPKRKHDDVEEVRRLKKKALSPTEEEMEEYKKLARNMHMAGSLGLARVKEMQKMLDLGEEEKQLYTHRRKRILSGKKDYTKAQLAIDTAVIEAKKKKVRNNLAMLNDPTLETTAVDWEAPVEVPSDDPEGDLSTDEDVFTATDGDGDEGDDNDLFD